MTHARIALALGLAETATEERLIAEIRGLYDALRREENEHDQLEEERRKLREALAEYVRVTLKLLPSDSPSPFSLVSKETLRLIYNEKHADCGSASTNGAALAQKEGCK